MEDIAKERRFVRKIDEELAKAVLKKDEEKVKHLLEQGADPNAATANIVDGLTSVFHSAVRSNNVVVVKHFLQHGADVNVEDHDGDTPLFSTGRTDTDPEIRQLLYRHGADINHVNKMGRTALMTLLENYSLQGFEFDLQAVFELLERIDNYNQMSTGGNALIHFVSCIHPKESPEKNPDDEGHRCVEFLQCLLQNKASFQTADSVGGGILHSLASVCCLDGIQFLVQNNLISDICAHDLRGQQPIHCLGNHPSHAGFVQTLDWLLENGSSINEKDAYGRTLLHYVSNANDTCHSAVMAVIDRGANVNVLDKAGLSPLHLAVLPTVLVPALEAEDSYPQKAQVTQAISALVSAGAIVNVREHNGLTPLHLSLRERDETVIKILLDLGADPSAASKTGEHSLHRATLSLKSFEAFISSICLSKINLDATDMFGATPLHWAVWYFEPKVIHCLIKMGASQDVRDNSGRTPAELALFINQTCVYEELGILYQRAVYPPDKSKYVDENVEYAAKEIFLVLDEGDEMAHESHSPTCESESTEDDSDSIDILEHLPHDDEEAARNCLQERSDDEDEGDDDDDKCNDVENVFPDCPLLQTLYHEDRQVFLLPWTSHVLDHKASLQIYVDKFVFGCSSMGMYNETCDNKQIAIVIDEVMRKCAEVVKRRNPLLSCEVRVAGSYSEGTKIASPDEFDYQWKLVTFSEKFIPEEREHPPLGYARLKLKDQYKGSQHSRYVNEDGYLDARQLIRDLYSNVNEALLGGEVITPKSLYLRKHLKVDRGSIDKLVFRWVGSLYKDLLVEVDIVPAIEPSNWKPTSIKCESQMLSGHDSRMGSSIVLKTPDMRFVCGWSKLFRISVSELETYILQNLPEAVLRGFILVKSLRDTLYMPKIYDKDVAHSLIEPRLSTYLLKTCFLHQLDIAKHEGDNVFDMDHRLRSDMITAEWAKKIISHLQTSIENHSLPSFFVPRVNLLVNSSVAIFNDKHLYEAETCCLQTLVHVGTQHLYG